MKKLLVIWLLAGWAVAGSSDTLAVLQVIRDYEKAAGRRDPEALRKVLALDDPRFREIEDHIPRPFGRAGVERLFAWIAAHPDFDYRVRYYDTEVFMLGDGAAYATAMHDWSSPNGKGSGRTTFILVRGDDDTWRIVHGHWSAVPSEKAEGGP
jgi:ketosteroid isomerase-like protein